MRNSFFKKIKDPEAFFEVIAALALVTLAYYLVVYFMGISDQDRFDVVEKETTQLPAPAEKDQQQYVNINEFGVIHVGVDSPSYEKSNFDVNPNTPIEVYFNDEVDPQEILVKSSLINKNTQSEVELGLESFIIRSDASLDGEMNKGKWREVWEYKIVLVPKTELKPVSMYEFTVNSGFSNSAESKTAQNRFSFEFLTADEPGVLSTNLDNRDYEIEAGKEIKVIFKSPMSEEELKQKTQVYPEISSLEISVIDKIMILRGEFAKRSYQLFIPANTRDIYGRELGSDFVVSFEVL